MEGSVNKSIVHPHLNDAMFILFTYWIVAISEKAQPCIQQLAFIFVQRKANFSRQALAKKVFKIF